MPISALDFRYPVICSASARLSFLHWLRDQLRPGRHNFKLFVIDLFFSCASGLYGKL